MTFNKCTINGKAYGDPVDKYGNPIDITTVSIVLQLDIWTREAKVEKELIVSRIQEIFARCNRRTNEFFCAV